MRFKRSHSYYYSRAKVTWRRRPQGVLPDSPEFEVLMASGLLLQEQGIPAGSERLRLEREVVKQA